MPPRTRSTRSVAAAAQTTLQGLKVSKAKTATKQVLDNVTNKKSEDVEECIKVKPTVEVVIEKKVVQVEAEAAAAVTKTRGKAAPAENAKTTRSTRRTKVRVRIEGEAKEENAKEGERAEEKEEKGEEVA